MATQSGAMYGTEWAAARVCDAVIRRVQGQRRRKTLQRSSGNRESIVVEMNTGQADGNEKHVTLVTAASRYRYIREFERCSHRQMLSLRHMKVYLATVFYMCS